MHKMLARCSEGRLATSSKLKVGPGTAVRGGHSGPQGAIHPAACMALPLTLSVSALQRSTMSTRLTVYSCGGFLRSGYRRDIVAMFQLLVPRLSGSYCGAAILA